MSDNNIENPFAVQTPEGMRAEDVNELFVDVFSDFIHVPRQGHTFLNGPRGSGKSMIFRFMLPDCQSLHGNKKLNELDYFSIYVPIKMTSINIIDLERVESHGQILLNEHFLTMFVATICFKSFSIYFDSNDGGGKIINLLTSFYKNEFVPLLTMAGYSGILDSLEKVESVKSIFLKMHAICNNIYYESLGYVKRLSLNPQITPYSGAICGYLDFLFPLLSKLKCLPLFPRSPIFLLIDDADNLNPTQKKILNTWVSYRTSSEISLKISTQLNYDIFRTVSGFTIDSPHDYSEVNIASVYTSNIKNRYMDRIKEIVNKRLKNAGINVKAEDFFPVNEKQEKRKKEIYNKLVRDYKKKGRGYRPTDDAYRYETSEYIKELQSKRQGSNYYYAGFKELVHISSGIIRLFLEPAALMFSEMASRNISEDKSITIIKPMIQHNVIWEYSNQFMFQEFDKLKKDEEHLQVATQKYSLSKTDKLKNLILGMGGLFHKLLVSDLSERRVFSIALNDTPNEELQEILNLGIQNGYLHESSISNKTRTGRSKLYILSRRLAPFFLLDPSSFAGYKHMNSNILKIALNNPSQFRREVLKEKQPNKSLFE